LKKSGMMREPPAIGLCADLKVMGGRDCKAASSRNQVRAREAPAGPWGPAACSFITEDGESRRPSGTRPIREFRFN